MMKYDSQGDFWLNGFKGFKNNGMLLGNLMCYIIRAATWENVWRKVWKNSPVIAASPVAWNLPQKIPTKIWSKQILKANNTDDWWCEYEPFCSTDDIYEVRLYSKNR